MQPGNPGRTRTASSQRPDIHPAAATDRTVSRRPPPTASSRPRVSPTAAAADPYGQQPQYGQQPTSGQPYGQTTSGQPTASSRRNRTVSIRRRWRSGYPNAGTPAAGQNNTLGLVSMILGIASIVICCLYLGIPVASPACVTVPGAEKVTGQATTVARPRPV